MREKLEKSCDAIEECYEFMLAYAAQGLSGDEGTQSGGQLRGYLTRAASAVAELADTFTALCFCNAAEIVKFIKDYPLT